MSDFPYPTRVPRRLHCPKRTEDCPSFPLLPPHDDELVICCRVPTCRGPPGGGRGPRRPSGAPVTARSSRPRVGGAPPLVSRVVGSLLPSHNSWLPDQVVR